jgi:hypothetical protein
MSNESQRDNVCDKYEIWLDDQLQSGRLNLNELKSAKRLGCWCKPKRCHGDYIKKLLEENEYRKHKTSTKPKRKIKKCECK